MKVNRIGRITLTGEKNMSRNLNISILLLLTILIAGCVSTTEADTESAEWKTFSNDKYGYSFEVPAFCFEGPLPGECKQSPPEERAEECLCFVDGTNPDSVRSRTSL